MPDVSAGIVQSFKDKSFGLTIAEPNTKFTPTSRTSYVELKAFDASTTILDANETDERKLIFQIELNYPANTGATLAEAKKQEILDSYSFNDEVTGTGFKAVVEQKLAKPGYQEKGWHRVILQIYFKAFVDR